MQVVFASETASAISRVETPAPGERMVMAMGRRVHVNESVVCAELDREAVLLNVETGFYFGLDPIGTVIWKLLEAGSSEEDIMRQLTAEYDVEPEQIQTDMLEFLDLLRSKGLVQVVVL